MRRALLTFSGVLVALSLLAGSAQAAPPAVGSLGATDLQGVSALLKGTVDPKSLATTYRFEYVDQASFAASGFAAATKTPIVDAGSSSTPRPVRQAVAGLAPSTIYHFRLTATNASGSNSAEATLATTAGFGLLPGEAGFGARAIADGGATA